jgi:hypothetical protein
MLADRDPWRILTWFGQVACHILSGGEAMYQILAGAAPADPQAAGLLAEYDQTRAGGQGMVTAALARLGGLRPGMTQRDAADVVHALASPEVYRLLVTSRGWTPERYGQWLTATLISQLLPEKEQQ